MGIVALWTRKKSLGEYSGRDLACAGIVAFIISFAVFLANYQCYIAFPGFTRLLSELTIFAGGMIAGANVVLFCIDRPNDGTRERRTAHVRSVFLGCFAVLLVEYMSYLLCAAYVSGNSIPAFCQVMNEIKPFFEGCETALLITWSWLRRYYFFFLRIPDMLCRHRHFIIHFYPSQTRSHFTAAQQQILPY